jgi:regulator of ribonuclease activity A
VEFSTPDLSDAFPETKALEPIMTNYGGKSFFSGPIETLNCPDDNSHIKEQLNSEGKGRILVVDAGGIHTVALLGDLIAEAGVKNNWSGIVINGYIRDVDIIRTLNLGVQALGTFPVKSEKRGLGDLGVEISFGGLTFKPGQYVYADNNGLLISEKELNSP